MNLGGIFCKLAFCRYNRHRKNCGKKRSEARYSETDERSSVQSAPLIVRRAAAWVLELFNRRGDARLVFHSYHLTTEIAGGVDAMARGNKSGDADAEIAQLAAWFLYTGYLFNYEKPLQRSLSEAERFLLQADYPEENSRQVLECIRIASGGLMPASPAAALLSDANQIAVFITDFAERSALLKLEMEFMLHQVFSQEAWNRLQLQHLLQARLYTHYAKATYEPDLMHLIKEQKERLEKIKDRDAQKAAGAEMSARPFRYPGKKRLPSRGTQTFFRANFRNHINLSAIADNKANIMISVNSILISVLISILTYRNISENQPVVFLPAVIFLVPGLASLIFAVLSARPKVTQFNRYTTDKEEIKKNVVFFGNFVHLDLQEYEEAMDAVFRDEELLYGNMTRDLYFLGKVLDKKYRYLSVSYNIFMVGFIATVGSFLLFLLLS